eukprot:13168353-Ditylum_brightwellii.AAC.1
MLEEVCAKETQDQLHREKMLLYAECQSLTGPKSEIENQLAAATDTIKICQSEKDASLAEGMKKVISEKKRTEESKSKTRPLNAWSVLLRAGRSNVSLRITGKRGNYWLYIRSADQESFLEVAPKSGKASIRNLMEGNKKLLQVLPGLRALKNIHDE